MGFLYLGMISSKGFQSTSTLSNLIGSVGRSSPSTSTSPMRRTLKIVSPVTFPKMVCFLSSHSHLSSVMRNCDWLVLGLFSLARATCPRWLNLMRPWNSSLKGLFQMEVPPVPVPVGSPMGDDCY